MSDNIKVVVKVRPLIPREIEDKLGCQWKIKNNTLIQLDQNGKETTQYFTFDKVYTEDTKTADLYKDVVKPIVEAATAGINGTIFAYGQTSSGKTYTMTGTEECPGIIPLAVQDLFQMIKNIPDRDFLVRVSYIEIYNDTINDMINVEKRNVKVCETLQGVKVDAEEKILGTPEEVLKLMELGQSNRHVGSTNMNEESSRSHSIFQITIESREHVDDETEMGCVNVSQLNLVDLAGSERAGQTGAKGVRFIEGTHINKSLSTLALVIRQLTEEPKKFISYRDSKLTRILQNSLGGNARTCIVCAVTPATVDETISTLQFANRAKAIKNKPEVNAVTTSDTMLQNLTRQMCKLQSQLESKKNLEKDNVNLQKQLVALQQLIINGFNQRSTKNIDRVQKKQSQLRRATISALPFNEKHISDSPPVSKPKFCTPLLKYNPACIENAQDLIVNQGPAKPTLSPVHEENPNTVTPPRKKTVNFVDEVIEIDSGDEENTSDIKVCSPVHDCYDSSKTPPCVLRKAVKQVERSLKEHIELTELEKMYSPKVVELIQQLQDKTTIINEMKEERKTLHKQIKDRDFEMEVLKHKMHKTEEEMKNLALERVNLESQCLDMKTKLTDLEVVFETFKKKSKLREDELLSLIADEANRKPPTNLLSQKPMSCEKVVNNFMDLSKDISLINSDNESSILEPSSKLVPDIHTGHISELNETVIELENSIKEQKLHNAELQKTIENLLLELTDFHKKNTESENDNLRLQSTIESLKSKISNQETDIISYNNVIRELQIKLTKKELTHINLNDSVIESILATDEKLMNTSDNMKIICQLKQTIDTRDSEINTLKSRLDLLELNNVSQNNDSKKSLQDRDERILVLVEKISVLEDQNNQYIATIEQLSKNICDFEEQITQLKEQNIKNVQTIEVLSTENSNLRQTLQDKTKTEESLSSNLAHLENKLQNTESEILAANIKINNLTKEIEQHLCTINQLNEKLTINNNQIASQLEMIREINKKSELLQKDNNDLNNILKEKEIAFELSTNKNDELKQELLEKGNQIIRLQDAIQSEVSDKNINMDTYLKENEQIYIQKLKLCETEMETSEKLLQEKNNELCDLKSNIENHLATMHALSVENEDLVAQKSKLNSLVSELQHKVQENQCLLTDLEKNKNSEYKSLITILQKTIEKVTGNIGEEPDINNDEVELLSDLLQSLDSAVSALISEKQNIQTQLTESTEMYITEIKNLKNRILDEETKLSEINAQNESLTIEITRLSEELDKSLKCCAYFEKQLTATNNQYSNLLPQRSCNTTETETIEEQNIHDINELKDKNNSEEYNSDTEVCMHELLKYQLQQKTLEIQELQSKTNKLKNQLENLGVITKIQLNELQLENIKLKSKCHKRLSLPIYIEEDNMLNKSDNDLTKIQLKSSPPTLLSICLSKIDGLLKSDQSEPELSNISISECQPATHRYSMLSDYENLKTINSDLVTRIDDLNIQNKILLNEQEEVRAEINLLLDTIKELQKKVLNHRTNLSTLTATTYAENQLLQSQVKALQHHHNRFYNVCLRDIPTFKKQLEELRTILKDDESFNYRHNISFKRYSLPDILDNNCSVPNIHNESTLDGDLLMLDTNVTLATLDNTLLGLDQTNIDNSQIATSELNKTNSADNSNLNEISRSFDAELSFLKNVNQRLQDQIKKLSIQKETKDAQSSPVKITINDLPHDVDEQNTFLQKIEKLSQDLNSVTEQKNEIENMYQNLISELPLSETLIKKINSLEQEIVSKNNEVNKLKSLLDNKTKQLNELQIEYEEISNQVIDNISEVDSLKEEVKTLKEINIGLKDECLNLKKVAHNNEERQVSNCTRQSVLGSHIHLNRSLSDSDSSSSLNKICTLQKELCAGKEECKQLTEEVTTIKNHLEQSNMSAMDLDESQNALNDFTTSSYPKKDQSLRSVKENMSECFEYVLEKTGLHKSDIDCNVTLTDLMKLLYDKLVLQHGNEIQNLLNNVKILEDTKVNLQDELCKIRKELEEANQRISEENKKVSHIKNNIDTLNKHLKNLTNSDRTTLSAFKDNVLNVFDSVYNTNSSFIFSCIMESIVKENENSLHDMINNNKQLEQHIENLDAEKTSVLTNLTQLKNEMNKREQDYNTLKTQKEMIQEISKAVTLDIVRKENEFKQTLMSSCQKLIENNIISSHDIDMNAHSYENLTLLFENIVKRRNIERESIIKEMQHSKELLQTKEKEIEELKKEIDRFNTNAEKMTDNVIDYAKKLEAQNSLYENLMTVYESKSNENIANIQLVEKLTEEILVLKNTLCNNEEKLQILEKEVSKDSLCNECNIKESYILEQAEKIKSFDAEIQRVRSANNIIISEKDSLEKELDKANGIIRENSTEIDKMKSDIIVLKESACEDLRHINSLKEEMKSLLELNSKLKDEFEEKCQEFTRLNMNIKTHERTAEIQSKMIMRLTTQHDNVIEEKDRLIEELKNKLSELQKKYEEASKDANTVKENVQELLNTKEELERRVDQLERERDLKMRLSMEPNTDHSKMRRQSLHDSKRLFGDHANDDNNKLEALFKSRSKLDDLFMDVDDDNSSTRTSPIKTKKNDSNQSRLDEVSQESSRSSSVQATRRRRQSIHDLHRSVVHSPHEHPASPALDDSKHSDSTNRSAHETEVSQLKERIAMYLEEIAELKERNKELDEECDTCAEYLKERDEQCLRLKKDKSSLEKIIEDLQEKLKSYNPQQSQLEESKRVMINASVNTDEDWANLHSVVVDRMSYDAEVDKNKRFAKVIEELRYKKQELRTTIGKMQAALDRNSRKESQELEELKAELDALRQELNEVKQRNKELDEECETCAQYLREREQQCRKLKEAKDSLEAKLEELQNDHSVSQSLRKKRQSIHDQNRRPNIELHDACTQFGDDLVTYQMECDALARKAAAEASELKRLKKTVDKLIHQKAALEHQVVTLSATVQPAVYVATGSAIVQNQQITDVMKENQKLKKMNTKLVNICKKRGKLLSESQRENEDPMEQNSKY